MFIKKNLNPTGKKKPDCVIRAIAHATGQTWTKVYQDLCDIGLKKFDVPNSKEVYEEYLRIIGWSKMPMPKKFSSSTKYKRYTAEDFAKLKEREPLIISVANHLTCSKDGNIIDSWDCGKKSVGNYWIK